MPKPFVSHDEFVACALEIQRNFDVEAATTVHVEQTVDELNMRLQRVLPIGSTVLASSSQLHLFTKLPEDCPIDEVWTGELLGDNIAPVPHAIDTVQGRYDGITMLRANDIGRSAGNDTVVLGYTLHSAQVIPTTGLDYSLYFSPIDATIVTHVDPKTASPLRLDLTDTVDAMISDRFVDFAALASLYKTLHNGDRRALIDYLNCTDMDTIASSVQSTLVIARHISGDVDKMPHMADGKNYDNAYVTSVQLARRSCFGNFNLNKQNELCVISPYTPAQHFIIACSYISGYTIASGPVIA